MYSSEVSLMTSWFRFPTLISPPLFSSWETRSQQEPLREIRRNEEKKRKEKKRKEKKRKYILFQELFTKVLKSCTGSSHMSTSGSWAGSMKVQGVEVAGLLLTTGGSGKSSGGGRGGTSSAGGGRVLGGGIPAVIGGVTVDFLRRDEGEEVEPEEVRERE